MKQGQTRQFPCSRMIKGRYVFVVLNVNEYLTLCEVEVYAVAGKFDIFRRLPIAANKLFSYSSSNCVLCKYTQLKCCSVGQDIRSLDSFTMHLTYFNPKGSKG